MKIRPVGDEVFHANGQTDMTKLTVAFRNIAKAIQWTEQHGNRDAKSVLQNTQDTAENEHKRVCRKIRRSVAQTEMFCHVTIGSYKNLSLSAATLQLQPNLLPAEVFQTQVPPSLTLKRLNVVHRMYLFIPRHQCNKHRLFSWTSVTGWILQWKETVFSMRYEFETLHAM